MICLPNVAKAGEWLTVIIPAGTTIVCALKADIVSAFIGTKDITFWRFGFGLCVVYFIVLAALKYKRWIENKIGELRTDIKAQIEAEGRAWRYSDSTIRNELQALKKP